MGLLDFQNFRSRSGTGAGVPQYGNVPMRQPAGNIPTGVFGAGPQPTGTYMPPGKAPLPSLSKGFVGFDPSLINTMATGGDVGDWFTNVSTRAFVDPLGIFTKPKGDNWKPLQTQNDAKMDYGGYFQSNPDVQGEWNSFSDTEKNRLFAGDPSNYVQWYHDTFGKAEGRKLTPFADIPTIQPQATRPPVNSGWTPGQMPTLATLRG
jgi:hypothetical protein